MSSAAEIKEIIHESPLTDEELGDIIALCTTMIIGNALMAAGLDMVAERLSSAAEIMVNDDGQEEDSH